MVGTSVGTDSFHEVISLKVARERKKSSAEGKTCCKYWFVPHLHLHTKNCNELHSKSLAKFLETGRAAVILESEEQMKK